MATIFGFSAILMWALLALLAARSGTMPAFQLAAMTFAIGTLVCLVPLLVRPGGLRVLRQPPHVWLVGVGGLFGYHALYFAAVRAAPPVEASLIAYLWPLLIVVGSALLPGERLRWYHIAGAAIGLVGTALVIAGRGEGLSFSPQYTPGYLLAATAAVFWAGYSLLSRRLAAVPSEVVGGFCAATAILSLLCHLLFEETVWPTGGEEWAAIVLLGLLPVGAAFFSWDIGVKRGDIQLLGAASYLAPILSTLALVAFGEAPFSLSLLAAALLITGGAALAALPMFRKLAMRGVS
ncbi:aromatic amino acid exporter YddG [Aureimonas phyllosphaerae]|uniref:Drug/metabolite transporter (DMT)-like permease n=1 Tax=Aureimonas phyllosphaerae TaxID=1166078 RepID=A0A7W6C122_9HYPH|nr:EamA family transporter [Aureimonas phyllosphaerae]MBB3936492.1 drug/metabolite transporter (DMT)-like permease [Aureimonas phyllosphaerae]MBB3960644.1 drug/metabolite transporter (DMT)-like permease [Aureimonas phyllosphaerae]SFF29521.1 EamA domain-containing membrane protein RarD [Aureimonas phyllosphaerae]